MPDVMGETALGLHERKKLRTRATLIDAAVELCNRQGFERTTVDQIAAIADVSPRTFSLEALYRSHVQAFNDTKSASANGLTSERLLASARIITSSPALKAAAADFRMDAVNAALAERMGVARDDRRPKLVAAVWTAILMTALGELGPTTDWASVTVDEIVSRLATTFAQFISAITDVRQPV